MHIKRFSLASSAANAAAFLLPICSVLLTGCSSLPNPVDEAKGESLPKTTSGRHQARKQRTRDPLVRAEIRSELSTLNSEKLELSEFNDSLKGPITLKRIAQIELENSVKAPVVAAVVAPEVAPKVATKAAPEVATEIIPEEPAVPLKTLRSLENSKLQISTSNETPFIFDIPVTYNERVSRWIRYFQTTGRRSFHTWLERSARFLPVVESELSRAGLPQDLVYVAMIESGFRPDAVSHAGAMGMWQFISATGRRYGLAIDWWIDERRDFAKSTQAAISYMKDLNGQFNSWYLVAASYNMGENGVRRLLKKHDTNDFWTLANRGVLPRETTDYVPKIIAATLIAKAPALYGFRDMEYHTPLSFETARVPGGTDLVNLATFLGVSGKYIQELNPELIRGFIPREVKGHTIRIPKGSSLVVSQFVRLQQATPIRESAQNDLQ